MNSNTPKPNQLLFWWVIWAAFLLGVIQFYIFLGRNVPTVGLTREFSAAVLGLIPFFISGAIRWLVLPRMQNVAVALPVFILGIAFAEATSFLGIFIFPAYKLEFLIVSILGILQFIPVFAKKYFQ